MAGSVFEVVEGDCEGEGLGAGGGRLGTVGRGGYRTLGEGVVEA